MTRVTRTPPGGPKGAEEGPAFGGPRQKKVSSSTWIGIGLAGTLVIIFGVVLVWRLVGAVSPPDPDLSLRRLELPAGIQSIVARMPAEPGNSADDYWQIVEEYRRDPDRYQRFTDLRQVTASTPVVLQTPQFIRDGARKREFRWYFEKTPRKFDLFNEQEWLFIVGEDAGRAVHNTAGILGAGGDKAGERALWEAFLIYGWHLCQERVRPGLFRAGIETQLHAAENLAFMYQEAGEAEKARAVNQYILDLRQLDLEMRAKLEKVKTLHGNIGNLFDVIEKDPDRMWRVEALLMLSFRRHTVKEPADKHKAEELLDQYSRDSDPFIAAAAQAAMAVGKENAANVHHNF